MPEAFTHALHSVVAVIKPRSAQLISWPLIQRLATVTSENPRRSVFLDHSYSHVHSCCEPLDRVDA